MRSPPVVTTPEEDVHVRPKSAYDLEVSLVKFITHIVDAYRFDNPTLNLSQATAPQPPIVLDPDQPPVMYDPDERAQTLALKVPPRVVRGRIPRTVTGEIALDKLSDFPNIIVQAVAARIERDRSSFVTAVSVRIFVNMYDENPDGSGYQDCLNITEALAIALTSYGWAALDEAYPLVLPMDWKLTEADTFPHFCSELTTTWHLPAGRPLPDRQLGYPYIGEFEAAPWQ